MIIKKMLVFLIVVGLVAVVAGCGGKKAIEEEPANIEVPPEVETSTEEETPVVRDEPEEVAVPVLNDIYFAFDKYGLTEESKRILEANAAELKRATAADIKIEGHCDERGTKAYNLSLGEKRAKAAKDYLVALGVRGDRITIISFGKERPFDTGHNEAAWAKNRRAHLVIKK